MDNYRKSWTKGFARIYLLAGMSNPVFNAAPVMPLYQNYNGIFMDEDLAVNSCVKYILF